MAEKKKVCGHCGTDVAAATSDKCPQCGFSGDFMTVAIASSEATQAEKEVLKTLPLSPINAAMA